MAGQVVVAGTGAVEREYLAHRSEVLSMLRSSFAGVPDLEELYQEAWAEVLELQASGQTVNDIGALLRTIAWRRGRDRLRKNHPSSMDPSSPTMLAQTDDEASPDEAVQVGLDAKLIWQVVDSLEPREAAVIKLRFERQMNSREIQRELGVSPNRLEKIVTEAYARVEQALRPADGAEAPWRRRQRSLLTACEAGVATPRQQRQAQAMLRDDPACRAMLADVRAALEQVAAILPFPVLASEAARGRVAQVRIDLADKLSALASRISGHGASVEAGAGGAASVGGGMAFKAALTCVAVSGTTVVCLTTGVTGGERPSPKPKPKPVAKVEKPPAARPIEVARVTPTETIAPRAASTKRAAPAKAAALPPASPAPEASTEFSPGAVGSTAASSTPAAAPDNGSTEFQP